MPLEIKQNLRLSQQLVITPQLQQAIKLLQLSRLELQNLVQHELLENPVLEEQPEEEETPQEEETSAVTEPMALQHESKEKLTEELSSETKEMKQPTDFDWENYIGQYNAAEMYGPTEPKGEAPSNDDLPTYENSLTRPDTLQEHLIWQLHFANLSEEEMKIADELIGNLSDDGYLQVNLEELSQKNGNNLPEIEAVLKKIQEFDPPGVGARNLQECLKLQIGHHGEAKELLAHIIDHHLANLEKKNFQAIAKECGISVEKVGELAKVISFLEPKPGRPFGGERPQYIVPDVFVHKIGEDYIVLLNDDGLPRLQISNFYRNALMQKTVPDNARDYIQDKLRSALWLIRSIHQRQRTLYKVTCSIVKFQKEFLEKGIHYLRPLVLRDVAEDIGMHESTISRVTNNKYAQTPMGLFELKYFFHSKVTTSNGEAMTSEAVKDEIRKMISGENHQKPLSDQEIAEMLHKTNIQVARRTVAKYREILGLLPSSRRKQAPQG
ncbi:MAG: RNA polymerase factor sigma-54 [Deltaproteobacteria bacterium]|nr:RNA polymerase factor sigma-54 [Deltaproteobacteria bacterium]